MTQPEASSSLSNSFTDLMTSLAVIFILLLCASLNNAQQEAQAHARQEAQAHARQGKQATRDSILAEVQKELKDFASGRIEVTLDPKDPLGLLVLVPEDLLAFPLDRADISKNGEAFLKAFIPKLAGTICSPRFAPEINSIVVEGHTDSSGTPQYNWDLSQKRSMSVVRTSLAVLDTHDKDKERTAFLSLLSASGRGSAELVSGPAGQENAALSRRVVFKIRVRSLEQKPLSETLASQGP
jgi:outer membrane protein OmpA-like peptidoglycan-associated protein